MAIPKNITREHILLAISKIDKEDVPPKRNARKWAVHYKSKKYPCKLLISWANIYANQEDLDPNPNVFQLTMAREYLQNCGFEVVSV